MADNPQPPIPPGVPGAPVTPMKKSTGKVPASKKGDRPDHFYLPSRPPRRQLNCRTPAARRPPPVAAPGGIPAAAPAAARPPAPRAAPVAAQRTPTAAPRAPASQQAAARPAPAVQRAPVAPAAAAVSPLDTILAIAACVTGLAAIGTTVWMMMLLNTAINS